MISGLCRSGRISLLFLATAVVSACSGFSAPSSASMPVSGADAAATTEVTIVDAAYQPKTLRTKAGTNVKFLNKDYEAHTVTADDGSFSSSILDHGRAWKHTFAKRGKYSYHCKIHPYMTGTVIVTK